MPLSKPIQTLLQLRASLTGGRHLEPLLRGAGFSMTLRVAGAALGLATQILLARWMGAFHFGVFLFAWSWLMLLPMVASLGLSPAVVRFVPEYSARNKIARLAGVIRRSRLLAFLGGLVITTAGMLSISIFDWVTDYYREPLQLALISVPLFTLLGLYSELARGFGWVGLAYAPQLVVRPALLVLAVGMMVLAGWGATSNLVLSLAFGTALLTLTGQVIMFERRLASNIRSAKPVYHTRHWLRLSLPLFIIDGLYIVLGNTDLLMLGFLAAPEDVAVYGAALKTSAAVSFVSFAVASVAVPKFVKMYYAESSHRELQAFVRDVARWTFWPTSVLAIGLLIFGKPILALYGPEFTAGHGVLLLLVCGFLLKATTGPIADYLKTSGNQNATAIVLGCVALMNVGLNAILIPLYGRLGAAVATVVAMVLMRIALYAVAKDRLGLHAFVIARP